MSYLRKGNKGNGVKNLQRQLLKAGVRPKVKIDGDFGEKTDQAVRALQKQLGMKPDGRACGNTLYALKYGTKPIKWTLNGIDAAESDWSMLKRDLMNARVRVIRIYGQNKSIKANQKAFAVYDAVAKQFDEKLEALRAKLREILKIERRFHTELKGYLMYQSQAKRDAELLYKDAMRLERDVKDLKVRHAEARDRFLMDVETEAA